LAFASGLAATSMLIQSLGPNAHIISVNDVYGGTFRYMRRVAMENQGLESSFLELENASDDEVLGAIRENTKVTLSFLLFDIALIKKLGVWADASHGSTRLTSSSSTFTSI
jgi:cystathionine gamma-lyase